MKFCYDSFFSDANALFIVQIGYQRYGQFLVNQLNEKYPFIIIPEEADCFHDNNKVSEFLKFIYSCDGSTTGTVEQDRD
jgi:hypothetical protein